MIETSIGADERRICRPLGDLDWVSAFSLRHAIQELLQPGIEILIDLSQVETVDATGISALVGSVRRVTALGGSAGICNARPEVERRLQLVGADRLLLPARVANGSDVA